MIEKDISEMTIFGKIKMEPVKYVIINEFEFNYRDLYDILDKLFLDDVYSGEEDEYILESLLKLGIVKKSTSRAFGTKYSRCISEEEFDMFFGNVVNAADNPS